MLFHIFLEVKHNKSGTERKNRMRIRNTELLLFIHSPRETHRNWNSKRIERHGI